MSKFKAGFAVSLVLGLFFWVANVFAISNTGSAYAVKPTHPSGGAVTQTPGAQAAQVAHPGQAGNAKGKKTTYKGVVAGTGTGSLTLTLTDGSFLNFVITPDTRIKVPTLASNATLADVKTGVQALVQADGSMTALRVNVIPGKPAIVHRVGTVTAYAAGSSITIQDKDGNTFSFAIDANTKVLPQDRAAQLAIGSRVTIISRRDVTGGALTAQGIVVQSTTP